MALDLSSLYKAVSALEDALVVEGEMQRDRSASDRLKQTVRAGVVQHFEFHSARNLTSHTYNPETAAEVARIAGAFAPAARSLLDALASRNA